MTDIKMLPLPETLRLSGFKSSVEAYARANVAHATAAKDAEIEALRAEVAAVWNAMPSGTRYLDPPDGGDVPLHEQVRRMAADAVRAERLVEALEHVKTKLEDVAVIRGAHGTFAGTYLIVTEALRDHDKEGKGG